MIVHDGRFESFFTALVIALERKDTFAGPEESLFAEEKVPPESALVEEWFRSLRSQYGKEVLEDVFVLFFADTSHKEHLVLHYVLLLQEKGKTIRDALQDPIIHRVRKIRQAYFREVHRFQGLVRFRETGGWLYAPIEPTHHILPYLWPHFRRRLAKERWIIHDTSRDVAVLYDGKIHWAEGFVLQEDIHCLESEKEKEIQTLWKNFYHSIAIPERKNPRQQRQMMPKKYWKYLVEKS
ncbi:MAG: TIGR03915 family putative DNA repair protein [Brevinematales bacterium]|nr:TIGR03915 family putative DNA repair protein [Brevinematales bacterium]